MTKSLSQKCVMLSVASGENDEMILSCNHAVRRRRIVSASYYSSIDPEIIRRGGRDDSFFFSSYYHTVIERLECHAELGSASNYFFLKSLLPPSTWW